MRSILELIGLSKPRGGDTVKATKGGVAVNGNNNGTIILNDHNDIKRALTEVMISQAEAQSYGVAGELQGEIGRQIDHYRDKMNSGRVSEALGLYLELLAHQAKNLLPASMFRIKANIAICKHLLGESNEAARLLLEACTYAPDDERAIAFKAFALIIQGQAKEAIEYGLAELKRHPNNENLAGFIIQASRVHFQFSDSYEDPFENFSDELKQSKTVRLAHIHFLSSREAENWRELADDYLLEEPDDLLAKSIVAFGVLQYYAKERQSSNGFKFSAVDIEKLKVASKHFEDYWLDFRASDRLANGWDLQVIQSLLYSYKLSSNFEALRELSLYTLSELADDQGLVEVTAKCLLDLDESVLCRQAIEKLENLDDARKLTFLLLMAQKDWDALSKYQDYQLAKFPDEFLIQAKVVVYIAKASKGDSRGKTNLEQLLLSAELDSRARLLLFEFSSFCGVKSIAQLAYAYGCDLISYESDVIEFLHYMRLLRSLMMWKEVIARLSPAPDMLDDYELKHMLALAYINEQPLRAEAVRFYEELANSPSGFELLLGIFYAKRNLFDDAYRLITLYYESGGVELYGFLALADIAKIQNNQEAFQELFVKYDIDQFDGTPIQWMYMARALVAAGDSKKGVELGYKIYSENTTVAEVALGYFHLFLSANKSVLLDDSLAVGADCRIKLVCSDGTVVERTVSKTIEDDVLLSPDSIDPYVRKVLGEKIGYEYQQEKLQGLVIWTLKEVKHNYLDAFHTVCATYESQFPEEGGLWSIKVEDGNVQSLLDFIKRQAERDEGFISTVTEKHIPLGIAAGIWKKDVFQVSDLLRSSKGDLYTCLGTMEERCEVAAVIEKYKGKDIVLDTYTAWIASDLGMLDMLKEYFGEVLVIQSSVDSMRQLVREFALHDGAGLSVGWRHGAFIKTEYTEAELKGQIDKYTARIESLESKCQIVQFDFPGGLDELTELLLEISSESIEPYFIAKESNALLVSDDGYSRGFAKNAYELTDSAWLQAIANEMMREGTLSAQAYVDIVFGLCLYKHTSVSIHSSVIDSVFERDSTSGLDEFRVICDYVGGPSAEEKSHIDLVLRFVARNWYFAYNPTNSEAMEKLLQISSGDAYPSAKVMKATSILLERVRLMPNGVKLLNDLLSIPAPRFKKFVVSWWEGHFY